MNIFYKFTATAILAGALSASVMASESDEFKCASGPMSEWMSRDAVRQSLTTQGYEVRKIEMEEGCYEAYTLKDGEKYEVYVNPTTGAIVRIKKK